MEHDNEGYRDLQRDGVGMKDEVTLSRELVEALLRYLERRPFQEVEEGVHALRIALSGIDDNRPAL